MKAARIYSYLTSVAAILAILLDPTCAVWGAPLLLSGLLIMLGADLLDYRARRRASQALPVVDLRHVDPMPRAPRKFNGSAKRPEEMV